MISHLRSIDESLAVVVAGGMGSQELPPPHPAAVPTRTDLPPSDAPSIVKRGPVSCAGRKLRILVTDGTPAGVEEAFVNSLEALRAVYELVTLQVGGVVLDDGTFAEGNQQIDGGPRRFPMPWRS